MSDEAFVSVVTPVYNTAEYLSECIESVLAQSHGNFEYLLVDNQSDDGSTEIARRYAERDARIRYLRTPQFFGQNENFSFALQQVGERAEFCKMVLADDWIFPRCLTELVAAGRRYPSSGIVSSYLLAEAQVWGSGLRPPHDGVTFLPGREAARLHLLEPIFLFGSPTTLLFRADVVRARKPFYVEGPLHSDTATVYEILGEHDFAFVHQVLSFTRQQEGSLSTNSRSLNPHELDRLIVTRRFGPDFLSAEEYRACLQKNERWFYTGLARHWLRSGFRFNDEAYWARQRRGLGEIGEHIRHDRLALSTARLLSKAVLDPLAKLRPRRG